SATAQLERVDVTGLERPTPDVAAPLGRYAQAGGRLFGGAAPVLGRLDPELVAAVAASVRRHRATEVRLTPWRGILVGALDDDGLVGDLAGLGLVVDRTDPASAVIACAGRTGCSSGT